MEQFFEQPSFADDTKVKFVKLKLIGGAQVFWEGLKHFFLISKNDIYTRKPALCMKNIEQA